MPFRAQAIAEQAGPIPIRSSCWAESTSASVGPRRAVVAVEHRRSRCCRIEVPSEIAGVATERVDDGGKGGDVNPADSYLDPQVRSVPSGHGCPGQV